MGGASARRSALGARHSALDGAAGPDPGANFADGGELDEREADQGFLSATTSTASK